MISEIVGSNKTKGPKHDSQNQSPMPEGGGGGLRFNKLHY